MGTDLCQLFAILDLADEVHAALDRALEPLGLTRVTMATLHRLATRGPLSHKDLAESADCVPSNITRLVERLVQQGFVERRPSEEDRRQVLVDLTEAGREALAAAEDALAPVQADLLVRMSQTHRACG